MTPTPKRIRYDDVEEMAMAAARKGHDIKLYFRYTGMLHVFHNGKEVLVDGPRDYSVALQKIQSIMWHEDPASPVPLHVQEKDVRRGKKSQTKKAKPKAKAKKNA